ncbi:hypothetical protein INS49_015317 [Diaporthe citri]|uniref:uncharacterized protein n=1 Tax=Diaporthe citri TaxID=83186 RepID=UPI001C8207B3|nr:uncharacterized protein INS49_015317 [Diaporthe citri]KAG6355933.1 hypothetical protein INS49_015317 [Diaporthe citri]
MSTENNGVYDLSESRQGNIIACAILTWLISAVVVASRMYLRGSLMKLLGPEDWVILAALFFSLAQSIGFTVMAGLGLGRHVVAIPPQNFLPMLEASWFTILFYTCSLSLSKVSVLLLYLRTLTICIVSIIRIVLLATIQNGPDYSYMGVETTYWSLIEINTAIVCASIMTLKPLFNRIFTQSTRQTTATPDEAAPGHHHQHIPLPTIGSRPSRKAVPPIQTRQSWLSAQLAKLDKSLQTVSETRVAGNDEEANLRRPETATAGSRSDTELPPWPPARAPAGRDRLSHNSSIITPVEQNADEGPLR